MNAKEAAGIARIPYARALRLIGYGILPAKRPGWRWNVDATYLLEWKAAGWAWRNKRKREAPATFH